MPFTLAHPAAALPIRRWLGQRVVPSALVVGTMIPDLPYYIALDWPRDWTHTFASLVWWALPAGWAFFLLYRKLLRAPIAYLLPEPLRTRMSPTPSPAAAGAVTLSLLLGALSHLLWDALTHESPMFFGPPARSLVFELLQNGSSVLGLGVLALWLTRLPRHEPPQPERHREVLAGSLRDTFRAALLVLPLICGLAYATARLPARTSTFGLETFAARAVIQGTSTFLLLLLGMGLLWRWKARAGAGAGRLEPTPVAGGTGSDTRSPP